MDMPLSDLIEDADLLKLIEEQEDEPIGPMQHIPEEEGESVRKLMVMLLYHAVNDKSTDVYLELSKDEFKVDYLVNGQLYDRDTVSKRLFPAIEGLLGQMFGFTKTVDLLKSQNWLQKLVHWRRTIDHSIRFPSLEIEREDIPYDKPLELKATIRSKPMNLTLTREQSEYGMATKYHIALSNDLPTER